MPYIHKGCGGIISFWTRKCSKCGRTWSFLSYFMFAPPKGMVYITPKVQIKRHEDYARWGNKIPYVDIVAGLLPRWPRWARVLSFLVFLSIISLIVWRIFQR